MNAQPPFTDPYIRAQFLAIGGSTMGVDPAWDEAMREFLACDIRARAQEHFGPIIQRQEAHERHQMELEERLGRQWREHPEGRPIWELMQDDGVRGDAEIAERFYKPLWAAQVKLAMTPAPSLAAVVFKAALIEAQEVYNDVGMESDCIALLDADLARLGGGQ